ncbi:MAG: hypothetical protein OEM15_05470 [Myxococcales bacterium]|nr:hypothetical protein [Myxococcales bacterium]MDH3484790.1 hypothetical protein [Myxococcales bacterium]
MNRTIVAFYVAVSFGLMTVSGALAQSGWGKPLEPKSPKAQPVPASEPSPAPELAPEPAESKRTEPNPDWADAPPTEYEQRAADNPDWIEEDEAPPVGAQRDNASGSYDIRYANRSLTMPRGMMRGTFDAVTGRRQEVQGMFEPFGPTGTISTLNLGAALTIATDFEVGFSRYRMGSYPPASLFPDYGFGGAGLISMILAPDVKFGDMPFYARFQPLNNGVSQIAIDAVVRIPTRTEVGFLMGVPMRFVAKEHYAFDTGIDFSVDNNPNGPSLWSLTIPFGLVANVTDQAFVKLDSGMHFFDLSQVIRTATSGLIDGPFYFFPLGVGGGYALEAGSTMIDVLASFRFPTLYGFTSSASEVNAETWAVAIGFNIYSPVLFKGSAL